MYNVVNTSLGVQIQSVPRKSVYIYTHSINEFFLKKTKRLYTSAMVSWENILWCHLLSIDHTRILFFCVDNFFGLHSTTQDSRFVEPIWEPNMASRARHWCLISSDVCLCCSECLSNIYNSVWKLQRYRPPKKCDATKFSTRYSIYSNTGWTKIWLDYIRNDNILGM